ncbi:MAG: CDP-alcohol phosphatidyltransferase family protein [Anaerolineales bacterium]|nr:CDP-alcohol phosphatidyltransferase family protein [Anaerolineales bacterium]
MNSKYRYLIPNGITFLSLTCGIVSITAAIVGNFLLGGSLILVSYILDLFDGATARRLNASSEFGLQLDSLVDMVSLGAAPAVLAFAHLYHNDHTLTFVWPATVLFVLAGAYRLARFNLLPPKKTGVKDSVGLTISAAGATLALAVLADISPYVTSQGWDFMPDDLFFPLMIILSLLMVSRIPYPSFGQVFGHKWMTPMGLGGAFLLWYLFSFLNAWFLCSIGYLTLSLARAGYNRAYESQPQQ